MGSTSSAREGRNTVDRPTDGSYAVINIGLNTVAASQTDLEIGAVELPFACRVQEISGSCTTSTGGASRGTFQVTDGTNDLITADALLVTAGSVNKAAAALVAGQRTRAKADRLQVDVTTVASEVVTALNVAITVWIQGHVVAAQADD